MPWNGHSELLATRIPGARVVHFRAAHLSNIETPRAFSAAVAEFLLPADSPAAERGMRVRREVLGDAHVDPRRRRDDPELTRDFQELITSYAWGTVWTRPGLDVRTRRLLVLAITASLGRWEEFRLHVRPVWRGSSSRATSKRCFSRWRSMLGCRPPIPVSGLRQT